MVKFFKQLFCVHLWCKESFIEPQGMQSCQLNLKCIYCGKEKSEDIAQRAKDY